MFTNILNLLAFVIYVVRFKQFSDKVGKGYIWPNHEMTKKKMNVKITEFVGREKCIL